jgi:hypothetical protein
VVENQIGQEYVIEYRTLSLNQKALDWDYWGALEKEMGNSATVQEKNLEVDIPELGRYAVSTMLIWPLFSFLLISPILQKNLL